MVFHSQTIWTLTVALIGMSQMILAQSVVDFVNSRPDLSVLSRLIEACPIPQSYLRNSSAVFTLIAPTDSAFSNVPLSNVNPLSGDPAPGAVGPASQAVLEYHIIPQNSFQFSQLPDSGNSTLGSGVPGWNVVVSKNSTNSLVNGATVTQSDIPVGNSIVQIVNQFIQPLEPVGLDLMNVDWGSIYNQIQVPNSGPGLST